MPLKDAARFVEDALQSILGQHYPNLDLIVVDGGSSDGTLAVLERYRASCTWFVSEPDQGMYDALDKGFARASGEVMGWLSATDLLLPGGLHVVGEIFRSLPEVEWITGMPVGLCEQGLVQSVMPAAHWTRPRFLLGANRYIQQESTFWRQTLWTRAGARMDASLRVFGDFELWLRFFRAARLFPVQALIGSYRHHADAGWLQKSEECERVQAALLERELQHASVGVTLRFIARAANRLWRAPFVGRAARRVFLKALMHLPGCDRAPLLVYRGGAWTYDGRKRG
jgi:hypothetical protein